MKATLTELRRLTTDVVRPVRAGREVTITEHGEPFARIVPFRSFDRKAALKILRAMGPVNLLPRQ